LLALAVKRSPECKNHTLLHNKKEGKSTNEVLNIKEDEDSHCSETSG
jgi:hypothetical protein